MALTSSLLFPPPSGDPRIQLAYNDPNRPIAFGEPQSQSVARLQNGFIKLGYSMPNSTSPLGFDGIFGSETLNAVKDFQRKNGLSDDGMVGKNTLDKFDAALLAAGPDTPGTITPVTVTPGTVTPGTVTAPTHQDIIDAAFKRSRAAVGFVAGRLQSLSSGIDLANGSDGFQKILAIQTLGSIFGRDIAVISDQLRVGNDPLKDDFKTALASALNLINLNLSATSAIIDQTDSGRCDAKQFDPPNVPFAATLKTDPDPRVSVCTPFFAGTSDEMKRDVLTHEFFHLLGLDDMKSISTSADALNDANTMAQVVAYINDRTRQTDSSGFLTTPHAYPAP